MRVLITSFSPKKQRLVDEFKKWGAEVVFEGQADLIVKTRDAEIQHPLLWDKAQFSQFCFRHGFDKPKGFILEDKLIAKPRNGAGSRGIVVLDRSYILQEFIDWPEYSIDYFADYNGVPLSCIPRERLDIVDGESQDFKLFYDPLLIQEAMRMGQELDIKGPATMQCFYDGNKIKWIEVNPRYGGGTHFTWPIFSGPKWQVENFMRESNVSTTAQRDQM